MPSNWQGVGLVWLRFLIGCGIASHGMEKIFGGGMERFVQGVTQMGFPLPALFAWAAALSEGLGGLCLAVGLGTRVAAFFVFCTMSVALFIAHRADPFRTKEMAYLYWSAAGALMMLGGGPYTLEAIIRRRR
jgi:putative oxidoreductase